MKFLTLGALGAALALLSAVPQDPATRPTKTALQKLAWLVGSWHSDADGQSSEEHWTGPAGNMMLGVHRDVAGDKAFFEYLRIEQLGEKVYYYASPMGRPATRFEMTTCEKTRVVFENSAHDFPQRILYWLENGQLQARAEATRDGTVVGQTWTLAVSSLK